MNGGCSAYNLSLPSIRPIIENCTELKELNFWKGVSYESEDTNYSGRIYPGSNVDYLVKNISPNIEKFSVQQIGSEFRDKHIKILVSRCTKLKELKFSGPSITNDSLKHIIDHLTPTLEKLELENVGIYYKKLFQLKLMPQLKSYNCFGYRWDMVHELREELCDVSVNGYPPMATICKKEKVKYDKYFYNDVCAEDFYRVSQRLSFFKNL